MNRDEILKLIQKRPSKVQIIELCNLLAIQNTELKPLIDLSFNPDKDLAFRASWILETLVINHPQAAANDLIYLLSRFKEVKHSSSQRHYAKMMAYITSPKMPATIRDIIDSTDMEDVIEQCFDWMIDPEVLVAVKVFSSETLFNLRLRYTWIAPELAEQLKHLMKNGSAAIQSRGRKLLNQL